MTRCDKEQGHVQIICTNFNQLLEGAKEEYRNISNDEDKKRLGLVLTWLDQEFHSFFKEIGITPDILIPALDELNQKINNIKTETDKIKDLAKKNDLNDLISKIDDIKTETDTIPTLFKYDEIGEIQGSINLAMRPVHSKIEALVKKSDLGVDNRLLSKLARKENII